MSFKKRFLALSAAALLLLGMSVPAGASSGEEPAAPKRGVTINVYNWGEYISNGVEGTLDVNAEFTRRTGIDVNYTTFDTNESLYSKLAGGGGQLRCDYPFGLHGFQADRRGVFREAGLR